MSKRDSTYSTHSSRLSAVYDNAPTPDGKERRRTRQDFSREQGSSKQMLGSYIIGKTLGEGEFGKVKLGWQKGSNLQVAVKMIRRDKLTTEGRRAKVDREINILRQLNHPNIVKYYEKVEDPGIIGVVIEYAAGGELFDYILRNHYLQDPSAQKLFAQLVSGVGYLHKNGIIHRDLKLENLLLDGQSNIIITDFGFANTFDPKAEVSEDEERRLNEARHRDKHSHHNDGDYRKSDLMSTSCGSPCYAAPELVVSDGLYHGRKVDVWSCGVILYAMLAGYLPYDDDPNNPEGDNINLLYKYICNSPLIFPTHISPRARDLLKQILVPDPKRRADLFEVARHSWLIDYSELVEDITRTVSIPNGRHGVHVGKYESQREEDVARQDRLLNKELARSSSMKDTNKAYMNSAEMSGLSLKNGRDDLDMSGHGSDPKRARDAKRRTVQVEYKAPQAPVKQGNTGRSPRVASQAAQTAVQQGKRDSRPEPPPKDYASIGGTPGGAAAAQRSATSPNVTRTARTGGVRSSSDGAAAAANAMSGHQTRPSTGGSAQRQALPPSRGSYGQPSGPELTTSNAQGAFSYSPKTTGAKYHVSSPVPVQNPGSRGNEAAMRQYGPNSQINTNVPAGQSPSSAAGSPNAKRGHHRRASSKITQVWGNIKHRRDKSDRAYPPSTMRTQDGADDHRRSTDSSHPSLGSMMRKTSDAMMGRRSNSDTHSNPQSANNDYNPLNVREKRHSRRFSFLPTRTKEEPIQPPSQDPPSTAPAGTNENSGTFYHDAAPAPPSNPYILNSKQEGGQFQTHKKFSDAYEKRQGIGGSGAAKRVMDLFRRRR